MANPPFTAALCRAAPCLHGEAGTGLRARLAATVRRSPHGVLVSTGCLLRSNRCRAPATHDSGSYLVVQPCDTDRRPRGPAIALGPILGRADADAVAVWLATGNLDPGLLHPRLRTESQAA